MDSEWQEELGVFRTSDDQKIWFLTTTSDKFCFASLDSRTLRKELWLLAEKSIAGYATLNLCLKKLDLSTRPFA